MSIKTFKEILDALRTDQDEIHIEGDAAKKIIKIKASGNIAWVIALGAVTVAVIAALSASKSNNDKSSTAAMVLGFSAAPAAVATIGVSATSGLIAIVMAGVGGIGLVATKRALTKLRNNYKVIASSENMVVLKRIK